MRIARRNHLNVPSDFAYWKFVSVPEKLRVEGGFSPANIFFWYNEANCARILCNFT
jgi:hypothetical protein